MKMILYLFLLFFCSLTSCKVKRCAVYYGQRDFNNDCLIGNNSSDVLRLFFNDKGMIYPSGRVLEEKEIKQLGFKMTGSSKKEIKYKKYKKHKSKLYLGNDESKNITFIKTLDSRIADILGTIDLTKYSYITYLTVGYNNVYDFTNKNKSDQKDYFEKLSGKRKYLKNTQELGFFKLQHQRESIEKWIGLDKSNRNLFIEVYWDGRAFAKEGTSLGISHLPAIKAATLTGMSLRKVNSEICKRASGSLSISLFSHSSGANVLTQFLFNQETKFNRSKKFGKEKEFVGSLLLENKKLRDSIFITPDIYYLKNEFNANSGVIKKLDFAMIAPSTSGYSTFIDFRKRSSKQYSIEKEIATFHIGFNAFDFALKKSFKTFVIGGILNTVNSRDKLVRARSIGDTSLGCLESEVDKVQVLFRKENLLDNFIKHDFSWKLIDAKSGIRIPISSIDDLSFNKKKKHGIHYLNDYLSLDGYKEMVCQIYNE